MNFNVPPKALKSIIDRAVKYNVDLVVLFGSRARRAENGRSDVDIAVSGGDFDSFYDDLNENADTLLSFDIANPNSGVSMELIDEIKKDGIIIYGKN